MAPETAYSENPRLIVSLFYSILKIRSAGSTLGRKDMDMGMYGSSLYVDSVAICWVCTNLPDIEGAGLTHLCLSVD